MEVVRTESVKSGFFCCRQYTEHGRCPLIFTRVMFVNTSGPIEVEYGM